MNHKSFAQKMKSYTILYVEDDTVLLKETSENFENMFLKVDTAIDGEEGFKKYLQFFQTNSKHYDIVITDINMPYMDGIKMIQNIKEINPNTMQSKLIKGLIFVEK